MDTEQSHVVQTDAAAIQNHFGSGVLLSSADQNVLFDSNELTTEQAALLAAGNFDGTGLDAHSQPSDSNLGNQIEVELTGSSAIGRYCTKVAIIGLSFDNTVQMDRMYFYRNEKQLTSKHYKRILTVFFNDFLGNNNCSRNLGGRIVIREAASFQLSRDPVMVSQDVQPDIFWRDFKLADLSLSLLQTIQAGMGSEYSADALSINITGRQTNRILAANDVTTKIGQKFKAETDNIQKITLLMGVRRDESASEADWFDWAGNLIISIYPLQSTVSCPTAIVPGLAIEFDPEEEPIVQLSYTADTLKDIGYILTDVAQPVDFVFNDTKVASGSTSQITPGTYYAVTVKRSGGATSGTIFLESGNDRTDDARLTMFSGVWVDVSEEDLWFQVWTDAAKVADGMGYDNGIGMQYSKTIEDEDTGTTIDYEVKYKSFTNTGENVDNVAVLQATSTQSVTTQDERTGNDVYSRQKYDPLFSFSEQAGITTLLATSEPVIIGSAKDTNPKQNSSIESDQLLPGLARGDTFCIVNPDADVLSQNLLGSKLIPNSPCSESYRIFNVEYCVDGYGDVNGDGYIDETDISLASSLIGEGVYYSSTQQKIIDGQFTTLELLRADVDGDGYVTANDVDLITQFVNKTINSFPAGTSFTHLCMSLQQSTGRYDGYFDCDGYVRIDGYGGQNVVDPSTLSQDVLLYDGYLSPVLLETDPVFTAVPFAGVTYQIVPQPYWQPHLLAFSSAARLVPSTFTTMVSTSSSTSTGLASECEDRPDLDVFYDPGRNDFFVPGNLIIGEGGQIINVTGSVYKHDLEIGTIILQLPETPLDEVTLNVFNKLVADNGTGNTAGGYAAMRYADGTTVQPADLLLNRVKFNVAIQAMVPNIDGYDDTSDDGYADGYGVIIDDIIGVYMDHSTGILKLTAKDMYVDQVYQSLITKIEITVYLKKAGWNANNLTVVEPEEIVGLLTT
jgi:hypothetical protein